MRASHVVVYLIGWTVISASVACSSSTPPGRVSVSGVVKVQGLPIPDGQIDFDSIDDGVGVGAARIATGGTFKLFLRPATYRVGIVSVEGGVSPAGFDAVEKSKIRVPRRYAIPASSGIEVKIDAQNRHVVLDLKP